MDTNGSINHDELLKELKDKVHAARKAMESTIKYSNATAKFIYDSNLNLSEKTALADVQKPYISANICEAHASRLVGDFILNEPSVLVEDSQNRHEPLMVEIVDGHLRTILDTPTDEKADIYQEALVRGFSVMKYWTEYKSPKSFLQVLKYGRVFNSTLTYFDPLAVKKSKEDSRYAGELFPKTLKELNEMGFKLTDKDFSFKKGMGTNSGFKWSYMAPNNEFIGLLCQHYERKSVRKKLIYAADGRAYTSKEYKAMVENIEQTSSKVPPKIIKTRMTDIEVIVRYLFIESKILEIEETEFPGIPLIWVDGNSKEVTKEDSAGEIHQLVRSYFHHAIDAQRMMNVAMQTYADDIMSMPPLKLDLPVEAVPDKPEWQMGILKPQGKNALLYSQFSEDGSKEFNKPQWTPRPPIPPEIANAFFQMPGMIQNILGAYGSEMGNPEQSLSGIAIEKGATNSNAAASPYVNNFLYAWNVLLQALVDMMPKYYTLPQTIPVMDGKGNRSYVKLNDPMDPMSKYLKYDSGDLKVTVRPGVSLELQNQRTLNMLFMAAPNNPGISQILNGPGLPLVFEMMNIRHKDQWVEMAKEMLEQQQQQAAQGPPPNPMIVVKQQEIQARQQESQTKAQIEMAKIQAQQRQDAINNQLEQAKIQSNDMKTHADLLISQQEAYADKEKSQAEIIARHAELGMKHADQEHTHLTDMIGLHHQINQSERQNENAKSKENEQRNA